MKTRFLILALDSIGLGKEDLKDALDSLKATGAILSYCRGSATMEIEIDPVKAELLKETFISADPMSVPVSWRDK